MTRLVLAGVLIAAAVPAVAQVPETQAPKSQPVATTDKSDVNRVICKKEETIGSRLAAKKVCLTVKEWQVRAEYHRDATERIQHATPVTPSG